MKNNVKNIIITILFFTAIIVPLFINIIKKDDEISISERRKLEQFPQITVSKIFDGMVSNKFEKYTMDQFIGREFFRKLKIATEFKVFGKKDYNNLYEYNGYIISQNYPLNEKSVLNITNKIKNIKEQYLTDENEIYYTIVPDKNYFVNNGNLKIDYNRLEKIMKENLNFAEYINIKDNLELEDYYKTDTHWKQENLVKIAKVISDKMNLNIEDVEYNEENIGEFKGVYSGQLPIVQESDNLKILRNNVLNNCIVYNYENEKTTDVYDMSKKSSMDKYDIYLSGAVSLIRIDNLENKNGKELIVFRDSYASSLIPLLVSSYSKVTLVDTRYISTKILNQYIDFTNQDVLFIYSTLVINNSSSLK